MKNLDKQVFECISVLATYTYLKEKYPDLSMSDSKDSDVKEIDELLKSMQKLAHLPNKKKIISDAYDSILSNVVDGHFDEEAFLTTIKEQSDEFSKEDKEYIVHAIMFVAHRNNELSSSEQEVICQVAHFLGLDYDIKKILNSYQNSEFVENNNTKFMAIVAVVVVVILGLSSFFLLSKKDQEIRMFNQQNVVFSEIHFNRFVIFESTFNIADGLNFKQAVFYLHGSAEVSFAASDIKYDDATQTLTLYYSDTLFNLHPRFKPSKLIDEIEPRKVTDGERKVVSAIVGIGSAYLGSVAGGAVGDLVGQVTQNPFAGLLGRATGGALGGALGYFLTSDSLKGKQLADKLTKSEKDEILDMSKDLIIKSLQHELEVEYKQRFEQYMQTKFSLTDREISNFEYKQREN